jgi:hypothetical protein
MNGSEPVLAREQLQTMQHSRVLLLQLLQRLVSLAVVTQHTQQLHPAGQTNKQQQQCRAAVAAAVSCNVEAISQPPQQDMGPRSAM